MKYGYIFVPESFRKDKDFLARAKKELDVDEMRIEYGENVTQRPEFDDIMSTIKEGDIIVTRNICHLSHTGKNFISLLANLQALKIDLVVTEQGIDTRDSINLFANVFKAAEDLDKDYLRKRQAEGIALAHPVNDFETLVLLIDESGRLFYDGETVKNPSKKCAKQIGVYQYETNAGPIKTVPAVIIE